MTKFFKNRQAKKALPQEPRTMEEINKEYAKVSADASQAQYQVFIYTQHLAQLNQRMQSLNQEHTARQALEKAQGAAVSPLAPSEAST